MTNAIWIGNRREPLWDDVLVDPGRTTAVRQLHRPQPREAVLVHDAPWEGDGCDFHCILQDDGLYRMYYLGWDTAPAVKRSIVVCYAESGDGKTWTKPSLGMCEFRGSRDNNIILDGGTMRFDNFSVFKDPQPGCPADERYKGVAVEKGRKTLWCFTSGDGIRFRRSRVMSRTGMFDTLNVAFWDKHANEYKCYIRDVHDVPGDDPNEGIRDIRWMASNDFVHWTTPVRLDFGAGEDVPLYTNVIQPYYRADHLFVGFPSRYVERKQWSANFDQLAGVRNRRQRMERHPRYGLAVTDCLFMCSRDGKTWDRRDEAFMTPGLEHEYNWVYGDCYPALGMIETAADFSRGGTELSLYAFENHWGGIPAVLRRHAIRIDGFASYRAGRKPCKLVTKPFVFQGSRLSVNAATSAAGYAFFTLSCEGNSLHSIEMFGDSLDRTVVFGDDGGDGDGELSSFAGKPVVMEITMSDADLFSFQFQ